MLRTVAEMHARCIPCCEEAAESVDFELDVAHVYQNPHKVSLICTVSAEETNSLSSVLWDSLPYLKAMIRLDEFLWSDSNQTISAS